MNSEIILKSKILFICNTLFISLFTNCLRLQVGRSNEYSVTKVDRTEKLSSYQKATNNLKTQSFFKDGILQIDYLIYENPKELVKYKNYGLAKPKKGIVGYNILLATETVEGCFSIEGPRGDLKEFFSIYPFFILLTFGLQLPWTVLDVSTLPLRILIMDNREERDWISSVEISKEKIPFYKPISLSGIIYPQYKVLSGHSKTVLQLHTPTKQLEKRRISLGFSEAEETFLLPTGTKEIHLTYNPNL